MASILGIDNAIGWAHWQLRGWRTTLTTTLGYTGLIIGLILLTLQLNTGRPASGVLLGWRTALALIQGGILVMFGGSRVAAAIRADLTTTRMIESHRLMPVSPLTAISGYLWGPTSQAVALGFATFLIGAFVTVAGGMEIRAWLGPNFVMATFAVFCWVVAAYAAFLAKGAWGIVFIVLMVVSMSQGVLLLLLPGLALLFTPLIGNTVFNATALTYEFEWPMLASFIAQAFVGAIFYVGAARKYRRLEDTALAVLPGMLLLTCWVVMSTVGIGHDEQFHPRMFRFEHPDPLVVVVMSIVSALFLALVPVANAARDRRVTSFSPLIALACAAIVSVLSLLTPEFLNFPVQVIGTSFIACGSLLVGVCYFLRIIYRATPKGWLLAAIWIGLISIGPVILDCVFWMLGESEDPFVITAISSFSPVGAMALGFRDRETVIVYGLVGQVALAVCWAMLFYATRKKRDGSLG